MLQVQESLLVLPKTNMSKHMTVDRIFNAQSAATQLTFLLKTKPFKWFVLHVKRLRLPLLSHFFTLGPPPPPIISLLMLPRRPEHRISPLPPPGVRLSLRSACTRCRSVYLCSNDSFRLGL